MDGVLAAALPHLYDAAAHRRSVGSACEQRGYAGAGQRSRAVALTVTDCASRAPRRSATARPCWPPTSRPRRSQYRQGRTTSGYRDDVWSEFDVTLYYTEGRLLNAPVNGKVLGREAAQILQKAMTGGDNRGEWMPAPSGDVGRTSRSASRAASRAKEPPGHQPDTARKPGRRVDYRYVMSADRGEPAIAVAVQ
jgi:hypothetical protein